MAEVLTESIIEQASLAWLKSIGDAISSCLNKLAREIPGWRPDRPEVQGITKERSTSGLPTRYTVVQDDSPASCGLGSLYGCLFLCAGWERRAA